MREPTPEHERSEELHQLYWKLGEVTAELGRITVELSGLQEEWRWRLQQRLFITEQIRGIEDGTA